MKRREFLLGSVAVVGVAAMPSFIPAAEAAAEIEFLPVSNAGNSFLEYQEMLIRQVMASLGLSYAQFTESFPL